MLPGKFLRVRKFFAYITEKFGDKITKLGFAGNPRKRFARIGEMLRVRTREAPRADLLKGLSVQLLGMDINTSISNVIVYLKIYASINTRPPAIVCRIIYI